MHYKDRTIEELAPKAAQIRSKRAVVGLDGFVDKIMVPVESRAGQGTNFVPFENITGFGQRIMDAAGKSCNIEIYPQMEKLGGNGPIMANALLGGGMDVRYIGALGEKSIHPVFEEFARKTNAISVVDPGVTHALEFADGKVMLGTMASMDELTYERIIGQMGEGVFFETIARADLCALVNWTMIPNMTSIFAALLDKVLPNLPQSETGRAFFFDLADPRKRSDGDIRAVLSLISRFQSFGRVTLGLNLAETQQVYGVLGLGEFEVTPDNLRRVADQIRQKLEIHTVVVHPRDSAACATKDGTWFTPGPVTQKPLITTGAGDHFNAGFATAQVLGLSPEACLTVAVSFSGQYVRSGKSPSLIETDAFLRSWAS